MARMVSVSAKSTTTNLVSTESIQQHIKSFICAQKITTHEILRMGAVVNQ